MCKKAIVKPPKTLGEITALKTNIIYPPTNSWLVQMVSFPFKMIPCLGMFNSFISNGGNLRWKLLIRKFLIRQSEVLAWIPVFRTMLAVGIFHIFLPYC